MSPYFSADFLKEGRGAHPEYFGIKHFPVLSALLGEMICTSGEAYLPKSPLHVDPDTGLRSDVSFCAQLPWLQHQSIRDNMCVHAWL